MEIEHDFSKSMVREYRNIYVETHVRKGLVLKQALSYKEKRPSWYITKRLISKEMKSIKGLIDKEEKKMKQISKALGEYNDKQIMEQLFRY